MEKTISSKGESAVKLLEEWQYSDYIRYIHSTFTSSTIPNDLISRGKVHAFKENLLKLFEDGANEECDSIIGAILK